MPPQSQNRKLPTSSKLVNETLVALHSVKGITLRRLYAYIEETYSTTVSNQRKVFIKKHITSLREGQDIINITGSGLSGHFKLVDKNRFVRKLNIAERKAAQRKTDPSRTGNSAVHVEAPVVLPTRVKKGVTTKRNESNTESAEASGLGGRTKRVTTKRKRHEDKTHEPTTSTVTEVPPVSPRRIQQANAGPQVLTNTQVPSLHTQSGTPRAHPQHSRTSRPTKRTKQTKAEPIIVGLETQLACKSQGLALQHLTDKQRVPRRVREINVEHQILSPENLMFPESQEFPLHSQEDAESQVIVLQPQANTQCTFSAVRTVHAALKMDHTNVNQLTPESQELSRSPLTSDRLRASTSDPPMSEEETEYTPEIDTPTISSSVHASTPIPQCSVLFAPQRKKSNSITFRNCTLLQSTVEGTPRSILTKKGRRIDL